MPDIFRLHVKAIDVIKPAVPRLGNNGQAPPISGLVSRPVIDPPRDDRVTRYSDAVRVCDDDRPLKKAALLDPRCASHFAVAI